MVELRWQLDENSIRVCSQSLTAYMVFLQCRDIQTARISFFIPCHALTVTAEGPRLSMLAGAGLGLGEAVYYLCLALAVGGL